MTTKIFKINGMRCDACVHNISKALRKNEWINQLEVNFATEKATVEFNEEKISSNEIENIIIGLGYRVVGNSEPGEKKRDSILSNSLIIKKIIVNNESGSDEKHLIKVAASLVINSNISSLKEITRIAQEQKIPLATLVDFKEYPDKGIGASCKQHSTKLLLGNKQLFAENGFDTGWLDLVLEENKEFNGEIKFVSHGEKVMGAILLTNLNS